MQSMLRDLEDWGYSAVQVAKEIGAENPTNYSKTLIKMKNNKSVGVMCGVYKAVQALHRSAKHIHQKD